MVSFFSMTLLLIKSSLMAFWLEGANHCDAWWDLMLLTRLPLALWTLCLIPMSSAFKLLLSGVAVMAVVVGGVVGQCGGI